MAQIWKLCLCIFIILPRGVGTKEIKMDMFIVNKNVVINDSVAMESHSVKTNMQCALMCSRSMHCPAANIKRTDDVTFLLCEFHSIKPEQEFSPSARDRVLLKNEGVFGQFHQYLLTRGSIVLHKPTIMSL